MKPGWYTAFAYNDESQDDYIEHCTVIGIEPHIGANTSGGGGFTVAIDYDTRKAQYISMTMVDSALNHFTDTGNMVDDDNAPLQYDYRRARGCLVMGDTLPEERIRALRDDDDSDSLLLTMYGDEDNE